MEKGKYDYYFTDVLYLLSKLKNVDLNYTLKAFWWMYIMDAVLGNPDRHIGNWGHVESMKKACRKNGVYRLAPVYANGASLFPRALNRNITKDWMHNCTFIFPNSKIMFESRSRSSYKQVLQSGLCPIEVLEKARDLNVVGVMGLATEGLLEDIRRFYRTIVYYRFNSIVLGKKFSWKGYA